MKARDMGRLGQLLLDNGAVDETQIVSPLWTNRTLHTSFIQVNSEGDTYSLYWWVRYMRGYRVVMALGYGGQMIVVIKELDVVIIILSNSEAADEEPHMTNLLEWVEGSILPAVTSSTANPSSSSTTAATNAISSSQSFELPIWTVSFVVSMLLLLE
jgi:CubicO group peptidase (beta-lactamase class C family)